MYSILFSIWLLLKLTCNDVRYYIVVTASLSFMVFDLDVRVHCHRDACRGGGGGGGGVLGLKCDQNPFSEFTLTF